jgi:hypothetical protein
MQDYLGIRVGRRSVAELATSAFPDAPVRADPDLAGSGGHGLCHRPARGLLRLAGRLEPGGTGPAR